MCCILAELDRSKDCFSLRAVKLETAGRNSDVLAINCCIKLKAFIEVSAVLKAVPLDVADLCSRKILLILSICLLVVIILLLGNLISFALKIEE